MNYGSPRASFIISGLKRQGFEVLIQRLINIFRRPAPLLDPLDAYAIWAEHYPPVAHNGLMKLEEQAMLSLLPDLKNKTILDLACGSGRYILKAEEQGASVVYGLDFSMPMLSGARDASRQLMMGNMKSLPIESDSMDVIICGLAVGHIRDLLPVFHEMSRVLHSGGVAIYSDIHPFGKFAGWKRKFRAADRREYSVEHYFHLYGDHHAACSANQLTIEAVCEPLIEGKHPYAGVPAILAIRARKS